MHGMNTLNAETRDRAGDLQIFSLTLSQLIYRGNESILVKKQIRIIREMLSILLARQQCRHGKLTHIFLLCAQKKTNKYSNTSGQQTDYVTGSGQKCLHGKCRVYMS